MRSGDLLRKLKQDLSVVRTRLKAFSKGVGFSLINGLGLDTRLNDRQVADIPLPRFASRTTAADLGLTVKEFGVVYCGWRLSLSYP